MLFVSNFKNHKIVIQSDRTSYDAFGNVRLIAGITVAFNEYKYDTDDKKIIAALKNHPDFGIDFRSEDNVEQNDEGRKNLANEKRASESLTTACTVINCAWKGRTEKDLRKHLAEKHAGMEDQGSSEDDPLE